MIRRLHTLRVKDIPLLAYDERDSFSVDYILKEFVQDAYGLDAIDFRPGDVVIDIGAHVGFVSLYLAKRFPYICIHAFEPHPLNYENFVDNLRLNDVSNVRPFHRAVTGDGRALMLRGLPRNTGGASAAFEMTGAVASGPVVSTTLDDIFDELLTPGQRCRLLKIDCEGLEYEILPRASVLDRVDYLAAEFHEPAFCANDVRATGLTTSARELAVLQNAHPARARPDRVLRKARLSVRVRGSANASSGKAMPIKDRPHADIHPARSRALRCDPPALVKAYAEDDVFLAKRIPDSSAAEDVRTSAARVMSRRLSLR